MEPNNLLVALRNTANELLSADGTYPILDYGWDDADTPPPQYTGRRCGQPKPHSN